MRLRIFPAIAALMLAWVLGCSKSDTPETVPVTGTVTYNGQPLEGAQVTFMATGAPRSAIGTTDAQGRFSLTTFESDDGAVPGSHAVTISKVEDTTSAAPTDPAGYAQMMSQKGKGGPPKPKSLIPEKYSRPAESKLSATVDAEGQNEFKFDLTK